MELGVSDGDIKIENNQINIMSLKIFSVCIIFFTWW
jgi:hypothetical protein